ncbi:hypothetical protein DPMN_174521 [Dreissena polymorpha]|uniref:Hemimethylated DNA-binding domain-containing protein n=1 Tax=Dreissena polymorpha TaxID=45954 RepID=A0A9D4IF76_DREPO|nr:hypothetical protein DPMN_174521 [Dreissena polymorpha]
MTFRDEKLTLKFYAAQVVRHIQHLLLKPKILAYLNDVPQEEQNIEIGAALVALWCQPTERIAESDVVKQLDELSDEVRDILQRAHPEHAVLHQNIIQDGLKEDSQTMEWSWHILDAINTVLYLKHSFKGGNFHNYCPQDNFIDKALKTKKGTPIIMCIIYAALARRLGVVLEPVNPPYHFMLRFKQHPFKPPDQMYVYINAFDGGKRLEFSDVAQEIEVDPDLITEDTMVCVTPCYVIELEVRNVVHIGHELGKSGDYTLLRTALEWSVLMKGDNIEARMNLARINLHLGVNLEEAQQMLQYVAGTRSLSTALFDPVAHLLNAVTEKASVLNERNKNHKIKVIKRKKSKTVEFAVGLVMIHKRLNYDCVISGWDYKCEASHEWKLQNPMTGLSQPFYIVLVEDGSRRYVAEASLAIKFTLLKRVIELEVRNVVHIGHELGKSGDYTLLRTALEWSVLMKGDNIEARMNLARINLHLGVNLEEAQQMLQYVAGTRSLSTALFDPVAHLLNAVTEKASVLNERNKNHKIKVIKRKKSKTVEFAVGLVMIHKRLNYDCVISGWDYKCEASHEWKLQNPMTGLSQPFYIVLVEDGSRRYVAEEDLEVHPDPHIISHREVGKYFSTFDGYRYIMNSEKVAEYPDDEDFSKILVHRHFGITLSMTCNGFDDLFFFLNL